MLTDDIPFTDMPVDESIDFMRLANHFNEILRQRDHYRNALVSIATSEGRTAAMQATAAKVALWQIDPDWRPHA